MPVGAVLASGRIVEALHRAGGFTHGFTFSHNPVTAAACLATLEILEREGLVERSRELGPKALARLHALTAHPHVGDVRGRGLMIGLELVADKATRRPFARAEKKAESLAARCFEHGLVVYPGTGCATGTEGDLVMVAPPLVITEEQIEELAAILDRSLTELAL
jgi:adenosylmethionine-8-amino-7-oxononanoate aminotransferase